MKTLLFSFMLLSTFAFSQVPNNSFENWTLIAGIEEPDNWLSNNIPSHISVEKSTDSYAGNFAVKIKSNGPSFEGPAPGWVGTTIYPTTLLNQLSFYYKCDSLIVPAVGEIEITSWTDGNPDIVGGYEILEENSGYELLNVPLSVNEVPDSLTINLKSKTINDGTWYYGYVELLIDSIYLSYSTGIDETLHFLNKIKTFPNPTSSILTIELPEDKVIGKINLRIIDLSGIVMTENDLNRIKGTINIQDITKGTYILQITSGKIVVNKKLIIN